MANTRVVGKRLKRGQFKSTVGEFYGTPKEVWGFRTAPARFARAASRAAFCPPTPTCSSWRIDSPASRCARHPQPGRRRT